MKRRNAALIVAVVALILTAPVSTAVAVDDDWGTVPSDGAARATPNTSDPTSTPDTGSNTSKLQGVGTITYRLYVVNKTKLSSDWTNKSQVIGSCKVGTGGGTCAVSVTTGSTRTISLSLGISRDTVAGTLGISSAATVTNSTTCTSPKMKAGQVWRAYPRGDRFSYQVEKRWYQGAANYATDRSGTLYAFNPKSNWIYCSL